jgi:AraC-like DNA-binding protein
MSNSHLPTIYECAELSRKIFDPDLTVNFIGYHFVEKWRFNSLSSPFWRLYRNTQGSAKLYFPSRAQAKSIVNLTPGKILLIPPDTYFDSDGEALLHFYLHFTARPPYYQMNQPFFHLLEDPILNALIAQLQKAVLEKSWMNQTSFFAYSLAAHALSYVPASALINLVTEKRVILAMSLIEKNFPKATTNGELAFLTKMNANALTRLFKKHTGISLQEYFKNLRMSKAGDLLLHSDKTISEIAVETGYVDRFQFSKAFKKARGYSPVQYRMVKT